jgi:hypothetical protein
MQILLLALLFLTAFADYKRLMVSVNYKPTQSSPLDVRDINHTEWKAVGLDSPAEIAQHDAEGLVFYNATYGLDFSKNFTYNPFFDSRDLYNFTTGLKYAMLFPYKLTYDTYRVEIDTKYDQRNSEKWYRKHFGTLILMYGTGTFTSGLAAGTQWSDQNIIGHNVWYLLKNGTDITKKHNHERFTGISMYPTLECIDSQGFREPVTKQDCADAQGNPCYDVTVSDTRTNYTTGQKFTVSVTTMIFPPPWMSVP